MNYCWDFYRIVTRTDSKWYTPRRISQTSFQEPDFQWVMECHRLTPRIQKLNLVRSLMVNFGIFIGNLNIETPNQYIVVKRISCLGIVVHVAQQTMHKVHDGNGVVLPNLLLCLKPMLQDVQVHNPPGQRKLPCSWLGP